MQQKRKFKRITEHPTMTTSKNKYVDSERAEHYSSSLGWCGRRRPLDAKMPLAKVKFFTKPNRESIESVCYLYYSRQRAARKDWQSNGKSSKTTKMNFLSFHARPTPPHCLAFVPRCLPEGNSDSAHSAPLYHSVILASHSFRLRINFCLVPAETLSRPSLAGRTLDDIKRKSWHRNFKCAFAFDKV